MHDATPPLTPAAADATLRAAPPTAQVGLLVRLEARAGHEATVADFLTRAVADAEAETGTRAWAAYRVGPTTFGIFDIHPDEAGRQAHLNGRIAAAIMGHADEWLASPPQIDFHDVLSAKLPRGD